MFELYVHVDRDIRLENNYIEKLREITMMHEFFQIITITTVIKNKNSRVVRQ